MDSLFERRNLNRVVRIKSNQLQKNVRPAILANLRSKYEGLCIPEGYCQEGTITIIEHSLGRTDLTMSGVEYHVLFQADICMPHNGQTWKGVVKLRSKIGVHIETGPIEVLLPRDLHLGDQAFDDLMQDMTVEFEVIGHRFQQGDKTIAVLGKLKSVVAQPKTERTPTEPSDEPLLAAPVSTNVESQQKVVTIVPTPPVMQVRKRKLNPKNDKE